MRIFLVIILVIFLSSCGKKETMKEGKKQAGKISEIRLYVQFEKVENLWRENRHKEAITFCKKYLEENPLALDKDKAQFALGYLYSDFMNVNRDYSKAIEEFEKVIKNFPQSELVDEAQYWIGLCYYNMSKFKEAIQSFTLVTNNYPDSIWAYGGGFVWNGAAYHIGYIYEVEYKDFEQALIYYNEVVKKSQGLAWKDRAIERIEKTFRSIELEVIHYFPLVTYGLIERSWILRDFEKAIKLCQNNLELETSLNKEKIKFALAFMKFDYRNKKREINKAKEEFLQFINRYPQSVLSAQALFWVSLIDWEEKEYNEAITSLQQLIESYPSCLFVERAKLRIAYFYEKLNQQSDAYKIYSSLLKTSTNKAILKLTKIYLENLSF